MKCGRKKIIKRKTQTSTIMALTNRKRCPSNNPDERHKKKHLCLFFFIRLIRYQGFVKLSVSQYPSSDRNEGSMLNLKRLDPERLLYPSTVQTQGLTRSQQSCKTVANHSNCLQKAKSSMLSISSKQLT